MNLALADPCRVPDRIVSTLNLPRHPQLSIEKTSNSRSKSSTTRGADDDYDEEDFEEDSIMLEADHVDPSEDPEVDISWSSSLSVSFNRRGNFIAVGYASGAMAVYDFVSKSISALCFPDGSVDETNKITGVSWSRHNRRILCASSGDTRLRLVDNTYPYAPELSYVLRYTSTDSDYKKAKNRLSLISPTKEVAWIKAHKVSKAPAQDSLFMHFTKPAIATQAISAYPATLTSNPHFCVEDGSFSFASQKKKKKKYRKKGGFYGHDEEHDIPQLVRGRGRGRAGQRGKGRIPRPGRLYKSPRHSTLATSKQKLKSNDSLRVHSIVIKLPSPVVMAQVHPLDDYLGLAVLEDGNLVLFRFPSHTFDPLHHVKGYPWLMAKIFDIDSNLNHVTCATFDKKGRKIYAATRDSLLIIFDVPFSNQNSNLEDNPTIESIQSSLTFDIPGRASIKQIKLSMNNTFLLINSDDGSLHLYNVIDFSNDNLEPATIKPCFTFKDAMNSVCWISIDFSGDEEYLISGCNLKEEKYELYVWNTRTGELLYRLTGPQALLHSISCHPNRPFIAVSTSDGLVDIWGPPMDWTAFAPDFQPITVNNEYIEEEDEFDRQVDTCEKVNLSNDEHKQDEVEDTIVDIITIDKIPVFLSDSENDDQVFYFETKIRNLMGSGRRGAYKSAKDSVKDHL